eukprot:1902593-Rhodomonas_salina.1
MGIHDGSVLNTNGAVPGLKTYHVGEYPSCIARFRTTLMQTSRSTSACSAQPWEKLGQPRAMFGRA